jgi:hypothetical protein
MRYTARIAKVSDFPNTNSLSVIAVLKTENGQLIEDVWVSFYLPYSLDISNDVRSRVCTEIGFEAQGYSSQPIPGREGNPTKGLQPLHALVGLDRKSIVSMLSREVRRGTVVKDKALASRNKNLVSRAAEWLQSAVKQAAE